MFKVLMIFLSTTIFSFYIATSEELHCQPKPGCHIARCDPSNVDNIEESLFCNKFPITCHTANHKSQELSDMKAQLEEIKTTVAVLNARENTVKCLPPLDVFGGEAICSRKNYAAGTLCMVKCNKNRVVKGPNEIMCNEEGRWSQEFPTCVCSECRTGENCQHSISTLETTGSKNWTKELSDMKAQLLDEIKTTIAALNFRDNTVQCLPPSDVFGGEVICTRENYAVGTLCMVKCNKNRVVKGPNKVTCDEEGRWSQEFPTCVCSECRTGENCQHSISIVEILERMGPKNWTKVEYAGNSITCTDGEYSSNSRECTCTDDRTREGKRCTDFYKSIQACDSAVSGIIKELAAKGLYPYPCDPKFLKIYC